MDYGIAEAFGEYCLCRRATALGADFGITIHLFYGGLHQKS